VRSIRTDADMQRSPNHKRHQRGTVAVVEDDASLNLAVSRLLQAAGFDTRSFESGQAVLTCGLARIADCSLLDVHLPDMTGFELQQQLMDAGTAVPAIIMTAYDDPMHRRDRLSHEAVRE
jgi:FixJ family two-component response regulator